MEETENFKEILRCLPKSIGALLAKLPSQIRADCQEIRLRSGQPLMLTVRGNPMFVAQNGTASHLSRSGLYSVSSSEVTQCFQYLCENSIHSHTEEIAQGFVTLRGGNRAGICGRAVLRDGRIIGFRDISSLNLRIARQVQGSADPLVHILQRSFQGMLLVGPPGSGKTTLLRDLARQIAGGAFEVPLKVSLVDERGELASCFHGQPQHDLGYCCDCLDHVPKAQGIRMAVRTLSPDVVMFDEIGSMEELESVEESLHTGVTVISSLHSHGLKELVRRSLCAPILESGSFSHFVLLSGDGAPGRIERVLSREEVYDEMVRDRAGRIRADLDQHYHHGAVARANSSDGNLGQTVTAYASAVDIPGVAGIGVAGTSDGRRRL